MLNNILKSKGIKLAFITALISGLAVFFNKFAVTKNINPYQFTTLKNILVGLIFSIIILTPFVFKKLKGIKKDDWLKLIGIGVVGGSVPFLLFFKGLSMTTAVSAGFIHKTLFIWVTILAIIFLKERISKLQYLALGVLLLGTIFLGGLTELRFGLAELLILVATFLWSIENIIAKKVLKNIDPKVVAWSRMFFGSIILASYVSLTNGFKEVFTLSIIQWIWIIISVGFLTAYVLTWYHALKHEKASTVASILVLASPITTLLNTIYAGNMIGLLKISGLFISIIGIFLFIYLGKSVSVSLDKKDVKTV